MNRISTLCIILFLVISNTAVFAQCNVVSDSSGTIIDNTTSGLINYNVTLSGAATYRNFGQYNLCGINFPSVDAPWSGNTNALSTVSYTFSAPITQIDVVIALAGVNTQIHPETFVFTTEHGAPTVVVNSGSCNAWIINGNEITSPSVPVGVNAIVTVSSSSPFSTLNIVSGNNSSSNGGSVYGLCDGGFTNVEALQENANAFRVFPNPNNGKFNIELNQKNVERAKLAVYDALGKRLLSYELSNTTTQKEIDLRAYPKGVYFLRVFSENKLLTRKVIVN